MCGVRAYKPYHGVSGTSAPTTLPSIATSPRRIGGMEGGPPLQKKGYKPLEAARILGISKESLLALERDGRIPSADRDEHGNRL